MHQNIQGKNVRITENVRSYIAEKVQNIKVHTENIIETNVVCEFMHGEYFVLATLTFAKKIFHTKEKDKDLYAAIDSVFSKIEREARRIKEKSKHIRDSGSTKDLTKEDSDRDNENPHHIVTVGVYEKPLLSYDALFTFSKSSKKYFAYLPIKQEADLYTVKVGHYPEFLFKHENDDFYSVSIDEEANFAKGFNLIENASWNIKKVVLGMNNIDYSSSEKYAIKEFNVGEAVGFLMDEENTSDYIVYINSVTDKPEALYRESEHAFILIRLFNI